MRREDAAHIAGIGIVNPGPAVHHEDDIHIGYVLEAIETVAHFTNSRRIGYIHPVRKPLEAHEGGRQTRVTQPEAEGIPGHRYPPKIWRPKPRPIRAGRDTGAGCCGGGS